MTLNIYWRDAIKQGIPISRTESGKAWVACEPRTDAIKGLIVVRHRVYFYSQEREEAQATLDRLSLRPIPKAVTA